MYMEWGHEVGVYSWNWQKVAERAIAPPPRKALFQCVMYVCVCAWVCMYVHVCVDAFHLPKHCLLVGPVICNNLSFILSVTPCPINILARFLVVTLPWWYKSKWHSLNQGRIEVRRFTLLAWAVPNNKPPRTPNWYHRILSYGKYYKF